MSSGGAVSAWPGYGALGVAKAAVEALVQYLAVELAPSGRINAIRPGVLDTKSFRRTWPEPNVMLDYLAERVPMGGLVTSADVAAVATFLLSDDSRMITGQTIVVDGGQTLRDASGQANGTIFPAVPDGSIRDDSRF
jgi:enoyl-[acyl-carrier protein] reductase III